MEDIRRYAANQDMQDRGRLLYQASFQLMKFTEELMNDAAKLAMLLETLRVLRNASGPGTSSAEEEIMKRLEHIISSCVNWLMDEGMTLTRILHPFAR